MSNNTQPEPQQDDHQDRAEIDRLTDLIERQRNAALRGEEPVPGDDETNQSEE